MKCKFCNAEMEEGETLCPHCGKNNLEPAETEEVKLPDEQECIPNPDEESPEEPTAEPEDRQQEEPTGEAALSQKEEKKPAKKSGWKLWLAILAAAAAGTILVCAILYGTGVAFQPEDSKTAGSIFTQAVYTLNDESAEKASEDVVAVLGDRKLTNGELQIYYQMTLSNFINQYGGYVTSIGLDPSKPLSEQVQDPQSGITWEQFFIENALGSWQRYAVLTMYAQDAGFTPEQSTKDHLAELQKNLEEEAKKHGFASLEEMLHKEMGISATMDGYLSYMGAAYEGLAYYNQVFKEMQPDQTQLEAYFLEHEEQYKQNGITRDSGKYVAVRHILLQPEGAVQNEDRSLSATDEQWAANEQKAQKLLDDWKAAQSGEGGFAQLAAQNSQDPGSRDNGGLYSQVMKGQMAKEFDDWCFDENRKPGDTGIVRTMFGHHIMYYVEGQDIWSVHAYNDCVQERSENFLQEGMKRWPISVDYEDIALSRVGGDPKEETAPTGETTAPSTAPAN